MNSRRIAFCQICTVLCCLISISAACAADWYIRPSGGSGSGTNWNTAWNGFSNISWSSVACGDTIWVAGGTYTQDLVPKKNCTSGSRLYIRRARSDASECTGAAGWSSGYDATVHQYQKGISFNGNYNYITVSGRTTAAGGTNGWWIDFSGLTRGPGIEWPNGSNSSYITIEYMDLQGPGNVTYSADGRGIDDTPFSSATNHTFSHLKIWNWESGIYACGTNYGLFEYIDMYDLNAVNWSAFHPNGIYNSGHVGGIVRYSRFHKGPAGFGVGEGIFFEDAGGSSDWKIYGNVFYDLNKTGWKSIEVNANVPNLLIFNNTFDNCTNTIYKGGSAGPGSGSQLKNNLFFNAGSGYSWGTTSNNLFISSGTVFADRAAKDYHIVSTVGANYPRNAGTNLSTYFTVDMNGVAYGGDGTWDVGAYEYGTSSAPSDHGAPSPPAELRILGSN